MATALNNKKTTWAWTMYDWANSVFSLTVATAIFPPYYESVTEEAAKLYGTVNGDQIRIPFLGFHTDPNALYSYALSVGFLLVALFSPILSGIADSRGNKKTFMKLFCYLGALSCVGLFFFDQNTIALGITLFTLGILGFGGSIVFYNAYLPEIATEDQFDKLSARGFSMGYIGSVLLLIINLITILFPGAFFPVESYAADLQQTGISAEEALKASTGHYVGLASQISFLSVGLWWIGFAQIPFRYLPDSPKIAPAENILGKGWAELKKVYREVNANNERNHLKRFLWAFFFLSMGVQTVMYIATLFGSKELHLPTKDLIIVVLIIQLIGILGAWGFSRISGKIGNIYALLIMVVVWVFICTGGYFVQTAEQYYLLGAVVGLVMGGIQSLFRSTYAKLIPPDSTDHASYFSFFDVSEKLAISIGTLSYGLIVDLTGSMRNAILALIAFFVIGLFFLARIKNFKSQYSAQHES